MIIQLGVLYFILKMEQKLKCYTLGSPIQLNRVAVLAKEPHCWI